MAVSVDYIHRQYHRENVADFDLDEEESKEFQKLSLNDVPQVPKNEESKEFQKLSLNDVPQVPNSGKPLEQKPAGDFLYQDITKCLAPYNSSPFWDYHNSLPKMHDVLILEEKPDKSSPSTYSPLNPPGWLDKCEYKVPSVEEYALLKSLFEEEESKEFQKLSLNDVPQVPNSGKPLKQKPAGDFLYQDISKCLAPDTFSPYLEYLKSRPEVVLILDEKPKKNSPSTYSPSNPPDWADKWVFKLPKTYEEYVRLKSEQVPSFMASFISAE